MNGLTDLPIGRVNVLGIGIHAVNMQSAVLAIGTRLQEAGNGGKKGYVCLAGAHGVVEAQRDQKLKAIFAEAFLLPPMECLLCGWGTFKDF
jgi:N-acetylglucosaminyldiphosphoundecaprenol N-acetyl-beta-D-mannosaminyltransferase